MLIASLDLSTSVAFAAPLLRASRAICPEPEKRSRTFLSSISNCIIEKTASFTRSAVGRVVSPSRVFNIVPFAFPVIILIFVPLF